MTSWKNGALRRARDGHEAKVSFVELFFGLVYVFAVTQISHQLLNHLTLWDALEALVLWFAVWLGWAMRCTKARSTAAGCCRTWPASHPWPMSPTA